MNGNNALTPRELEVLAQVAHGLEDKEIGAALGISSITVRNHLAAIREKTSFRNRTQLAVWFTRRERLAERRV